MKKKFVLIILIFFSLSSCGYTPIYSDKNNIDYSIVVLEMKGDRDINNFLKSNLNRYSQNNNPKKIMIKSNSSYKKNVSSKTKKGSASNYKIDIVIIFNVDLNGKERILSFSEQFIMKKIDDFVEQKNYEKNIKKNITNSISEELILVLSKNNDT